MLHELASLIRFFASFLVTFVWRCFRKGWRSALIHARCEWWRLYIHRRNKRGRELRVECPCCGWKGYDFYPMDGIRFWEPSVACPNCEYEQRQRMLHLYVTRCDPQFFTMRGNVLHIAPEHSVARMIQQNPSLRYFSTDLTLKMLDDKPGMKFRSDVQDLPFRGNGFDIVFCVHVLEHVPDDVRAVAELHRVLKPGGVAYVMVPFDPNTDRTFEFPEPNIELNYHVRGYALSDFKHRLDRFEYQEIKPTDFLSAEEVRRFRIPDKEVIYRCVKPQRDRSALTSDMTMV